MQCFPSEDLKHLTQFTLEELKTHMGFDIVMAGGFLFLTELNRGALRKPEVHNEPTTHRTEYKVPEMILWLSLIHI